MVIRKSVSLKEQAYKAILDGIITGQVKRGQIYSEQWFADSFQISRTPVREALLQLRTEGLIEVRPNRGVAVYDLTEEDARNLMQMRSAIESFCASYMAEHFREPEAKAAIERIRAALERCHENFNQADEMLIHEEIIRFSKNPLFIQQWDNLRTKIEIFWWDVIKTDNRREEVYREHKYIIDSITVGDPVEARRASMTHSRITLEKIHEGGFPKQP